MPLRRIYAIIHSKVGDYLRKLLDKMFKRRKLTFWVPIIFAALIYLLYVLFGMAENKITILIETPIVTLFWLFGVFLVIFVQVKNQRCPDWFINLFELGAVIVFTGSAVIDIVYFVISGFQNFDPIICAGIVTYSSVSWVHNKRRK